MPTLVTGASGLLGLAVLEELRAAGRLVRCHVGPPGTSTAMTPAATSLLDEVVEAEVTDESAVASMCSGVDAVVHLAGPPSVAASFVDPVGCMRTHVVGTATVLQAAVRAGVRRFVYVSSAEVYGPAGSSPVPEDAPRQPQSPYAVAKEAAEGLVRTLAVQHGLEAVVLRPFSVYGARSPERSVVGRVLAAAAGSDAVRVRSLGSVRDYVHVSDHARAVRLALEVDGDRCGVYNVGSGVGTSVAELARLALAAAGREVPVLATARPDRPGSLDTDVLVADVARASTGLGFAAEVPLAEGLAASHNARVQGGGLP